MGNVSLVKLLTSEREMVAILADKLVEVRMHMRGVHQRTKQK